MSIISRTLLAIAMAASISPAFAQSAPPAVPALPDTDRVQSYSITNSTCACAVNFSLYGDSTDYQNWLTVYLNGFAVAYNNATLGWTITSPTGPLSSIARPITDAVLTFNNAQTGTVQIIGARRPRRVSQFAENRGVAARDLNQALTDLVAQNRETWDLWERAITFEPGFTPNPLPLAANRAGMNLCFDPSGQPTVCVSSSGSGTISAGNGITFTGTNPTALSTNITGGIGITVAPSGAASQVSLANAAANTAKCNPTGGTAALQDCTGSQISNSLGLALTPFINTFTANHTIATTDCGGVVQMGTGNTGQLLVTLPAITGFTAPCPIRVYNGDAYSAGNARGKIMSGFPSDVFYILFPHQSFDITISNGAWVVTRPAGIWEQQGPQLYATNGGSDTTNDCLSVATGCATIGHVVNGILYPRIDNLYSSPIVYLNGGTFNECLTFQGQLRGVNVGFIEGLSQTQWNGSGVCGDLVIGDNAEWETANITFSQGGSGGFGVYLHQTGVVDMLTGTYFANFTGAGAAIGSDHGGFVNFDQSGGAVNITGSFGTFMGFGQGTQVTGSFTAALQGTVTIGTFLSISGAGTNVVFSSLATSGTLAAGTIPISCSGQSFISGNGSTIPGTGASSLTNGCLHPN